MTLLNGKLKSLSIILYPNIAIVSEIAKITIIATMLIMQLLILYKNLAIIIDMRIVEKKFSRGNSKQLIIPSIMLETVIKKQETLFFIRLSANRFR